MWATTRKRFKHHLWYSFVWEVWQFEDTTGIAKCLHSGVAFRLVIFNAIKLSKQKHSLIMKIIRIFKLLLIILNISIFFSCQALCVSTKLHRYPGYNEQAVLLTFTKNGILYLRSLIINTVCMLTSNIYVQYSLPTSIRAFFIDCTNLGIFYFFCNVEIQSHFTL